MKVAKVHRMFQGIIMGVFMFAAYFLVDMYVASVDPNFYENVFKSNEMYFIMFAFTIGVICAVIYLKVYRRQVMRRGSNVN